MPQTTAEDEATALRMARSRIIRAERARQGLNQVTTVRLINHHLERLGRKPITRSHYAYIDTGRRPMTEPFIKAAAAALGISEPHLRNPLVGLSAAA